MNLPTPVKVGLGALLVALAAFSSFIDTTTLGHAILAIVPVSFLAIGIGPELGSQFGKLIPLPYAHVLGLAVAVGTALVQSAAISDGWKAIVSAVLATLVGLGIQPVAVNPAAPVAD
jgi:hypothetical protein